MGWVGINNSEKSVKLRRLVEISPEVIRTLPWNSLNMEKDKFLAPDFTSLDLVTTASNIVFTAEVLPNYYDIRDNEGFKNSYFNNTSP